MRTIRENTKRVNSNWQPVINPMDLDESWSVNQQTEKALIGSILHDNDGMPAAVSLSPDDFYTTEAATVFNAMKECYAQGKQFDLLSICNQLQQKGQLTIEARSFAGSSTDNPLGYKALNEYVRTIKDQSKKRKTIKLINSAITDHLEANTTGQELIEFIDSGLEKLKIRDEEEETLQELADKVFDKVIARQGTEDQMLGLPTGFDSLDKHMLGLEPGTLTLVCARPGVGKSAFGLNIAENIAKNHQKHVLLYSMEMSSLQVTKRLMYMNGLSRDRLSRLDLAPEDLEQITHTAETVGKLPISVFERRMTLEELRASILTEFRKHPDVGLIMVDYLQLMRFDDEHETKASALGRITYAIRDLAKELNVPIVALAQLNRDAKSRQSKEPVVSDIRDSGEIEQAADNILFIHRPGMLEEDGDLGATKLILAKFREGEQKHFNDYRFDGEHSRFKIDYTAPRGSKYGRY